MGRWLWIPAVAAAIGAASLAEVQQINALGVGVFAAPYVAAVMLTAWAGRRHTGAAVVGAAGAGVMASLSWWEATHRQTEGFEWEFNNALQFSCCLGANYLVLSVVAVAVPLLARPMPPTAGEAPGGAAPEAQPPAAADPTREAGSGCS
jgi:hypothetical protein